MFGSIFFNLYYVAIKQFINSIKIFVIKTIHEMSLQLPHNGLEQDTFKYVWSQTCSFKFWIIHIFENFISSIEIFFTHFGTQFDNLN